jgi:Fe-S-cluster-containing dehydrogenase component
MNPHSTDTRQTAAAAADLSDAMLDEFPEGASEFTDEVSRRRFLTVMGASLALAGAGCNLRPAALRKIVPYTTQPDEITPGVPLFFATAAPVGGYGCGVLVRSHEGRPIKVEGNPDHPSSLGGASIHALASVLDLYDPDRSRAVTGGGFNSGYEAAVAAVRGRLYDESGQARKGAKLRLLSGTVTSPTLAAVVGRILADFPDAKWAQHEPAEGNARAGSEKAFGSALAAVYDFRRADVVLSLDADFLCQGPGAVRYSKDFAARRKVRVDTKDGGGPEQMNRLYVVESMPSVTGSAADHRLALPSGLVESFARALARELGVAGAPAAGDLPEAARQWVKPLADDLRYLADKKERPKGTTLVVVGDHQPASLHALAHAINARLENVGRDKPVRYVHSVEARPAGKVIDLKQLTEELDAGQVETLLILSSNPAYTAPADVPFAEKLQKVALSVHLGTHQDETAVLCDWHVPEAHYLETWGDVRGHDGTVTIQQPLIAPLHGGRSAIEFLSAVTAAPNRSGYDIVRAHWAEQFRAQKGQGAFETFWQEAVRTGVVPGTAALEETPRFDGTKWAEGAPPAPPLSRDNDLEINFRADPALLDGRYANNGWLQELPKPVTRMSWDNAVYVSPKTAADRKFGETFRWTGGEHGRAQVPVVELRFRDRKVLAPVWVLPGHPDNAVTVHLGFGRTRAGKVAATPDEPNAAGEPVRGFNAYALRTSDAAWFAQGATIAPTNKTYYLACVQGNFRTYQTDPISGIKMDRKPVRHGTLDDYKFHKEFARIPPAAAGETELINENVPGPAPRPDAKSGAQQGKGSGAGHNGDDHKEGGHNGHGGKNGHDDHGGHDKRLHPLTMYHPNDHLHPNLAQEQQRRWGMAVDLSACTGCSSCVVACVGENNTPVVGKYEVTRGRLMHWINVDRYYEGPTDNAAALQTYFQPRMCVQCEKAPCEVVCPVGATVHSSDGLNDMVYNRCVGTRYCSNNCPYKVRRFNFLTYADWTTDTLKLGRNPDVSVRSRGVMEKCTFCVQRIRGAEIVAEREHRPIRDGEIVTACQAACPSDAIVFGDLNDPDSVVSRWKREPTNYGLLAELNTMPRLTHLAALRNPNPAMPKGV